MQQLGYTGGVCVKPVFRDFLIVFALLSLYGACGVDGDRVFQRDRKCIMYGDPDNSPEHMAVVALSLGSSMCSGTLVSSEVILTAAHCADNVSTSWVDVYFGSYMNNPDHTRSVSEKWVHPQWSMMTTTNDVAMFRLSQPAPASITPIPFLPHAIGITDADIGQPLEFVGFGQTETGQTGRKMQVFNNLDWICTSSGGCSLPGGNHASQNTICEDQDPGGACFGDSGGPAFIVRSGQEYVAGITSYGDENCREYGCFTKVDEFEAEIADFVGGIIGSVCTDDLFCLSGFCVDGVCCDSACPGECDACNLPGMLGYCNSAPDGTACPNGDACDGDETCQAGQCSPGSPPDCDNQNPCTIDSCEPATGCVHNPVQDGTSCTNLDVCDGEETCQSGVCAQGEALDCDDQNRCTADSCDPISGCHNQTLPDGTDCGGGLCGPAACQAGQCQLSDPSFCDDGDPCTDLTCDPAIGCLHNPTPDGTACPNGNLCDGDEFCHNGLCAPGNTLDCNDRNPCTQDGCDPLSGCTHSNLPDGTDCGGGPCGPAACQAGTCVSSDPEYCADDNPCTQDWCDPLSGCVNEALPEESECGYCMKCIQNQCVETPDCVLIEGGCGCGSGSSGRGPGLLLLGLLVLTFRDRKRAY
jgi:MYXO-CTERM domain-containing protein